MIRQTTDSKLQGKRRGGRQHDALMVERALLNGDPAAESMLARMTSDDLRRSPLLAKARGESLIRAGRLKEGLELLEQAVKSLAAQGQHGYLLDALASLSIVRIRTGNGPEAATILRFLREEFARSAAVTGVVAHALAMGAHLLDEPADISAFLNAAFDAYAQEPRDYGYGALLLDVWTGLAPPEELTRWESRAAWAQQQVHLGRNWEAHVRCVQGMNRYYAADWPEAVVLLEPLHGFESALGRYHAALMGGYRFLARCRCGQPGLWPTESEFRQWDGVLREEEADLALKFHAEMLSGEWMRLRSDPTEARAARRRAEIVHSLSGMPQQARMLADWDKRDADRPLPSPSSPPPMPPSAQPERAAGSERAWRFYCFGKLRLARGGEEAGELVWKRRKTKELLAYLLLQPQYESPRDRVVEMLFAGAEPDKAANRLYVAIHELKRTFQAQLGAPEAVALKEGQVRLCEPIVEYVDVEQYGALARVGEQMWRQDRELALEMFDQACQLYDDLLPEMPYVDWLEPYREALLETQTGMLRRLALQAAEEGNAGRAESYLAEWLRLKPLQEEAHYEMIALLASDGRQMEALNWYRQWEKTCSRELGSAPMPETRQLVRGLLS